MAYAMLFDVVEVNTTFYHFPKPSTARAWRKEVDEIKKDFEFTLKAHKMITHISAFTDFESWEKIKRLAEELRARIILFQTPKTFKDTPENVEKVKNFFSSISGKFIYAMEARGWSRATVEKVFPELGLIHVVDPFKEQPIEQEFNYYRLHGLGPVMYRYRFTEEDLKKLKEIVKPKDYVFFNNVFMYEDAKRFLELIK